MSRLHVPGQSHSTTDGTERSRDQQQRVFNVTNDPKNVGIFNRVNFNAKPSDRSAFDMYSEWASLQYSIQTDESNRSVLSKLPGGAGKDVAIAVVKHLAQNLGISNAQCEPSNLETDRDVQWTMEVMCYGLTLPLSEHDTIRDCVNVYCEWLTALMVAKDCVPRPVREDPNMYACKIIRHLYNLFVPRNDSNVDTINRQAVLCHRVLRTLQNIARDSRILSVETWESLLKFLLAIDDTLLAPPTDKDDVGDQLCERIVSVLFEVWLLACARSFPSPPLWKTFRDMCLNWRHRPALVEQWHRVNVALTSRLLKFMYAPPYPELKVSEEDYNLVPLDMTDDCVSQSWFRFLHVLSNPVDLCYPTVVSQTPKFLHFAITSEDVVDPCQHRCLAVLPQIFCKAMRGVAVLVDAFLGIAQYSGEDPRGEASRVPPNAPSQPTTVTPPQQRRIAKSFSVAASSTAKGGNQTKGSLISLASSKASSSTITQTVSSGATVHPAAAFLPPVFDGRPPLARARPKCNSILHLFGAWLFEAALVGAEFPSATSRLAHQLEKGRRPSSLHLESRGGTGQGQNQGQGGEAIEIPEELTIGNFEGGRAEALGALCRIFCAKKTGEDILPVYLARFYLAVHRGLSAAESGGQVLSSVLLNSHDLLRLDLDGVLVLAPRIVEALETVLPEREPKFTLRNNVNLVELRRASIHLLLSLLPLPLHFKHLPIKELLPDSSDDRRPFTFHALQPRLVNLLISALQCESDSVNTQMLLGGLMLCVQSAAMSEEVEQVTLSQHDCGSDSSSLLLSSASTNDAISTPSEFSSGVSGSYSDIGDHGLPTLFDSAHSLFVKAIYLVCHRLITSWTTDLNVSLAALELLAGFAKIKLHDQANKVTDSQECKRAVRWICDYIVHQCSRPPPFHSKDMHSTIVAAFHCVTTWLVEHPFLMQDKECLETVMEVIELGISGSKSQSTDVPRTKGEKECKPASMRVKDSAEALLAALLEQVGHFPAPSGHSSLGSLMDEETLLGLCGGANKESAVKHFRYFVVGEGSIILALLEQSLGNDQDPHPTVTVLVRGPYGKNSWTMQLRHLPRHKSGVKMCATNPGRPVPINELGIKYHLRLRFFPDSVERIPTCKAEKSIPPLESLVKDGNGYADHDILGKFFDSQVAFEDNAQRRVQSQRTVYPNPETECKAPEVCQDFETARLFLSHFGFLTLDSLKNTLESPTPSLMSLDATQPGFAADLEALDSVSNRTCDTVFIFYVKSGQKTAEEILTNVTSSDNVHPHFLEFLLSLGWPVDVAKHPGWTGHVSTSFRVTNSSSSHPCDTHSKSSHGGSLYSGRKKVLYWSDATAEMAFVVPSPSLQRPIVPNKDLSPSSEPETVIKNSSVRFERCAPERHSMPGPGNAGAGHFEVCKPRTLSLELDKVPEVMKERDGESPNVNLNLSGGCYPMSSSGGGRCGTKKIGRQQSSVVGYDAKIIVVWLERFEDMANFPLGDLVMETSTGLETLNLTPKSAPEKEVVVIFLHALRNGLFRVKLQAHTGKINMAIPLVDGMLASRRVLGALVRQTTLNMCRRKRLESDNLYPPHLRRKLKIQEIVERNRCAITEPEFYVSLFGRTEQRQ